MKRIFYRDENEDLVAPPVDIWDQFEDDDPDDISRLCDEKCNKALGDMLPTEGAGILRRMMGKNQKSGCRASHTVWCWHQTVWHRGQTCSDESSHCSKKYKTTQKAFKK